MQNNTINLVLNTESGLTEQTYKFINGERSLIGSGRYVKSRSEIVDSLSGILKNSPSPEVTITSLRTGNFAYPGYEVINSEELEAIAAELRSKVEGLKIVVE